MSDSSHYVIRGGQHGRERLRVMSRVLRPTTVALLRELHLGDGLCCLDAGCGGGDTSLELARMVGPSGRVVGIDIDATKLEMARREAADQGVANVEFCVVDIREAPAVPTYDVVYSRFLLTHLRDPQEMVASFYQQLRPGGSIALEDIDFSGLFVHPPNAAFQRYVDWYYATVRRRGGDPDIGPRIARILSDCGFERIALSVVQPAALAGEVKTVNALTAENIAAAVIADGLATQDEVNAVARELHDYAADPLTIAGFPRIFQYRAERPYHKENS
jgi:ubiquinone/menaquinone biosynthesis C-methylase UbiE